jgi:beta-galactosidase
VENPRFRCKIDGRREPIAAIVYQGDIARIYAGGPLITDDFYHGAPWEIGLEGIPAAGLKQGLDLEILPLRADAPIYLANVAKPSIPPGSQVAGRRNAGNACVPSRRGNSSLKQAVLL